MIAQFGAQSQAYRTHVVALTPEERKTARLRIVEINELVAQLDLMPRERIKKLRLERLKERVGLRRDRANLINSLSEDNASVGGRPSQN